MTTFATDGARLHVLDAEPPNGDVIDRLEETLALAREGRISSIAIALVYRDGTSGHCWSSAPSLSCLIGAAERMKHAIVRFSEE
jgi:hypothetical protein